MEGALNMTNSDRTLNTDYISKKMQESALNNQTIAETLKISKQAVSDWFKGKKLPSPKHLLGLAKILNSSLAEIISLNAPEPIVAFRKSGNSIKKAHHFDSAQNTGKLLRRLVPFLPGVLTKPPVLLNPDTRIEAIREYAKAIRNELNVSTKEPVSEKQMIELFHIYKAILIPVLWGKQKDHDNALHVYLPDSMTTWIFLNLDTPKNDFLFWMAHEFAHLYSTELISRNIDTSEKFADQFATELLFPIEVAKDTFNKIQSIKNEGLKVNLIKKIAKERCISPITIDKQLKAYAVANHVKPIELKAIFGAAKKLNQEFPSVSESLHIKPEMKPEKLIETLRSHFNTPLYDALKTYLESDESVSDRFISSILQTSFWDSKSIYEYLKNGAE
jgi:Zn-dependent peptidase ImmA (M78 family)/transcriptional regulator with XRE-family HTH domain